MKDDSIDKSQDNTKKPDQTDIFPIIDMDQQGNIKYPPAYYEISPEEAKEIYNNIFQNGAAVHDFDFMFDLLRLQNEETIKMTDISICFRAALCTINYLSTEDPSQLHFHAAREVLNTVGGAELEANEKARDLLARELVKECNNWAAHVIPKAFLQENTPDYKKTISQFGRTNAFSSQLVHSIEGKLWLDEIFARYISKIGDEGKEVANEFSKSSCEWYRKYLSDKKAINLFRLWIDADSKPYNCRYIKILATILWKDRVQAQFQKSTKNVPALTQTVHPAVSRILSPRTETRRIADQLQMIHEGKIIANLPTIDPKLIPVVTKGVGNLNSIYHHKLLRYECKMGFENWIHERPDARVLRFERGCTEIAECLGLKSNRAIDEIKALLTAQAYMQFKFDDGSSGNLIVLRNFRSKGCNRDDGVEIVLGTQLLPHYTFQTSKQGRLLIPVPDILLLPLVSSSNYHAGQALLQMMVMEEFTEHSMEFEEVGSITIDQEQWERFAKEVALPESVFKQTLDRWIQDGNDQPRFLIKLGANKYALGDAYKKETEFLKHQGSIRRQRQKDGERSAARRQNRKNQES